MNEQLSTERFQNVKKMLESSDSENHVVALSILEEQDFKENLAFILLAKKASHCGNNVWEENAPTLFAKIKAIKSLNVDKVFTYKDILRALKELNAPYDQVKFYLDTFAYYLKGQLASLGYDFIEEIEFNVKLKPEYEQRREPSESQ